MKSVLRPTSPEDLSAVSQLLQRVFGSAPDAPFLNPEVMKWKYQDLRGDWDGPRAYVLERDGAIAAHAGIWPLTVGDARGIQMIDWASAPEAPGAGLLLVQKLAAMFDFIYSIGGSEMTRKALPAFGFQECAQQWKGARPLHPVRQILTHQGQNWKLVPRLARNVAWSLAKAPQSDAQTNWKAEEIDPRGIAERSSPQSSPRPAAFFDYLLRCPAARVHLYVMRDQLGAHGHFALGVLRGQARLAGVWLREPTPGAWQTAFLLARQAAAALEGACEFVAAGTEGMSEQAAVRSGLRIVGERTPVYLLNKKGKLTLPADFQFQLSDDDGFFLDTGEISYWT